jgi:hypothetical protein
VAAAVRLHSATGGPTMLPVGFTRIALSMALSIAATFLLVSQAGAQNVACGNGMFCPRGNVCLMGGLCARVVDAAPGSIKISNGTYCDPGFRESKFTPGKCVPPSYTECRAGIMCAPGTTCNSQGDCDGPAATGPECGQTRCLAGRICASTGRCMNTELFQDCRNGSICSKHAACQHPTGCAYVAPQRTRQFRQ